MGKKPVLLTIIGLIGALLFLPFLGQVHLFDWDEINFAESAREMLLTGNFWRIRVDFEPFWQKPPLFIWLQTLSMYVFGVNEFAARLPNALCGIATLMVIYAIGSRLYNQYLGILWMLAYAGSFLPHFYFKSGIIDPVFNLFIFLGIYFLSDLAAYAREPGNYNERWSRRRDLLLAPFFIGLAVLTKGPVGLLLPALALIVFWAIHYRTRIMSIAQIVLMVIVIAMVTFAWYGVETIRHGPWFLTAFVKYHIELLTTEDAGHGGPIYYHFIVLLLGCFPASILIFRAFKGHKNEHIFQTTFHSWMIILLCVVLVVFSLVQTKIVHYSSLAYFPITFLAAFYADNLRKKTDRWAWYNTLGLFVIGGLIAIIFAVVPFLGKNTEWLFPYINDPFAKANLTAAVTWTGVESVIGFFYLALLIIGYIMIRKQFYLPGVGTFFLATLITVQSVMMVIVPKIEGYTQRAAIEFYKERQGEDCYVEVLGFKSFAHLFYSRKLPKNAASNIPKPEKMPFQKWLLKGAINKPAYFVAKITHADKYKEMPELTVIDEKNGFVFFKREP